MEKRLRRLEKEKEEKRSAFWRMRARMYKYKEEEEEEFKKEIVIWSYVRDIEVVPDETECLFENLESYISVSSNIQLMAGINTSMHYIVEGRSYTALHEEDGQLSSINLMKCDSPKLWLVVDYRWQTQLEKRFADYMRQVNLST